jgi:hypothetical protein
MVSKPGFSSAFDTKIYFASARSALRYFFRVRPNAFMADSKSGSKGVNRAPSASGIICSVSPSDTRIWSAISFGRMTPKELPIFRSFTVIDMLRLLIGDSLTNVKLHDTLN